MLSRFNTVPERDEQTDRQTDKIHISTARQYCCADAQYNNITF